MHKMLANDVWRSVIKPFVFCCLVFLSHTFLNQAFAAIDNVRFQKLSISSNLSQQNITAIYQDSTGFIWFGTQEGLNRYDGSEIEVFSKRVGDPTSLSSSWIDSIVEDAKQNLWIGTDAGVNRFNRKTRTFEQYLASENGLNASVVINMWTDLDGVVWVATDKGLNKFLEDENRFQHYNFNTDSGEPLDSHGAAVDPTGGFWLGSSTDGLFRFDSHTEVLESVIPEFLKNGELEQVYIRSLYIDSNYRLWIGTARSGIYLLDLTAEKVQNKVEAAVHIAGLEGRMVTQITEDKNGTIWFATTNGLGYYMDGALNVLMASDTDRFSISDNSIRSILIDRSGVFWLGSAKGVDKWNTATTQFDYYSKFAPEGRRLSGDYVTLLGALQDGRHFVGTFDGLDFIQPKTGLVESWYHEEDNPQSLQENAVTTAKAASDGKLWIGYQSKALSYYDKHTSEFTHFSADRSDPNALYSTAITSILETRDGTMWFSTFGGGISKFNPEQSSFTTYRHDPNDPLSISGDAVMHIYESSDGLLWLATFNNGISVFNPETEVSFRIAPELNSPKGLGAARIWSTHEDKKGNIWIGTHGAGLHLLTKEDRDSARIEFSRLTRQDGLPSNVIYGILEDNSGMLWLSSNRGLTRLDPSIMQIKNFTAAQGLQDDEFNSGAFFQTDSGLLLFGGLGGVTVFDPDDVKPSDNAPKTVITAFNRLNTQMPLNQVMNDDERIELSYKDYLIGFEFSSLDYVSPKDNRYRYRLNGFDEDWIDGRDSRLATYTNLPAGNYVFEVISANSDGIWSDEPASIKISVAPPPWKSPIAYFIYVVLCITVASLIYRYYQNKMHAEAKYRESLEQEVNKRTQELQAANEQLLNASISDQLTGLYNRRYLFDVIEETSINTFKRFMKALNNNTVSHDSGPRLFFLMFDLDGFKPINDTYGHDAGDKTIQQVANLLGDLCRITDTVIRWGGDEFVVIGQINHIDEVTELAENIRNAISKYGFDIGLAQKMRLSCSIGFSVYPFCHHSPDSVSWEQVNLLADKALYMSKDFGRNAWHGIVQGEAQIPFTTMNALNQKLDQAIENKHVKVLRNSSESE